ncbi:MAG: hypothetical protein A3J83_03130, partial [Elusimicrobia bacterium RIFOXYA2_FULL_40_6]
MEISVEAFEELVKVNSDRIFNLCYRLSGNYNDANDLAQDVFVQAFKNIKGFKEQSNFSTWLHRIAVNLWINKTKRNKIVKFVAIDKQDDDEDGKKSIIEHIFDGLTPEQIEEKRQLEENVRNALENLNEDYKIAVVLKYVEGKSLEEISKICNCS